MIISHRYRYLFVEIPLTGSWAIALELCEFYDGQAILHKHATYPEFRRIATEEERQYYKFATVRNPLDLMVSGFFKVKMDHKGMYSGAAESVKSGAIDYADAEAYERIRESDMTFESSFLKQKLWERPYSDMIDVSSHNLDFVIHFEQLQDDFSEVLKRLGIKQIRPVPQRNKTKGREGLWSEYYTPKMIERARRTCGPFMQKWGYDLPPSWGELRVTHWKQLEYQLAVLLKRIYLTHFRYNDQSYARAVRKLHAYLRRIV